MARIFYSMAGEGRGHAARARTLVEHLKSKHDISLFASDDAYEFLAPLYADAGPAVRVHRIPGLRFHYSNGRLDLVKSLAAGLGYAVGTLHDLVFRLERKICRQQPDLVISDFEPALPRAARRAGVPFVSVNHQHFLVAYDLSCLPVRLRHYAWMMGGVVRAYHTGQAETIVSSFFAPPLKPEHRHVRQVGPLLRPEIVEMTPAEGDYLVAYLRSQTPPGVLDVLKQSRREVRIYGLGARPREGALRFHAIDERWFTRDLAGCAALVGAAGNQVLGEALFLGKPVFAMPESKHYEQRINAHFLEQMGGGDWVTLEAMSADRLGGFLDRLDDYQQNVRRFCGSLDGTRATLAIIARQLNGATAAAL